MIPPGAAAPERARAAINVSGEPLLSVLPQDARQLGSLEVHEARAQPATAAVHFVTDPGQQHQKQEQEGEQQQRQTEALPHAGRNRHRDAG